MNKRAQASLEFMTTYGWAIMVTAIALGGLSYMISTDMFVGNTCYMGSAPISCADYALSLTDLNLKLQNNIGREIREISIECDYDGNAGTGSEVYPAVVPPGSPFEINCTGIPGLNDLQKAKVRFSLIYRETEKSFNSSAEGYIILQPGP